jgi:hypothetical protein
VVGGTTVVGGPGAGATVVGGVVVVVGGAVVVVVAAAGSAKQVPSTAPSTVAATRRRPRGARPSCAMGAAPYELAPWARKVARVNIHVLLGVPAGHLWAGFTARSHDVRRM